MSIGGPQSFNRYSYVQNDPVNLIDPSGLLKAAPEITLPTEYVTVRATYDDPFLLTGGAAIAFLHFGPDPFYARDPGAHCRAVGAILRGGKSHPA